MPLSLHSVWPAGIVQLCSHFPQNLLPGDVVQFKGSRFLMGENLSVTILRIKYLQPTNYG